MSTMIDPTRLYQPSDFPFSLADLAQLNTYPPPRDWCRATALRRAMGGSWQWVGQRADGEWHPWGPPMELSL